MSFWKKIFGSGSPKASGKKYSGTFEDPGSKKFDSFCDAAKKGDFDTMKALLKPDDRLAWDRNVYYDGDTLLHRAARKGQKEVAELLLANGADMNRANENSLTPFHEAIKAGHMNVAQLFLDKSGGAKAKENQTELHFAANYGYIEYAKLLLANGVDTNARDKEGKTPLHTAAECGKTEMVRFLLEHKADANAKDEGGITPLHFAENGEIVELLLAHKADVNAKTKFSTTPLKIATNRGNIEAAKVLRQHGGKEK